MTRYLVCRGGCGRLTGRVSHAPPGSLRVTMGGYITGHEHGCPGREAPPPRLIGPDELAQRRQADFLINAFKALYVSSKKFTVNDGAPPGGGIVGLQRG